MANARGHTKSAILFQEREDGWIYELTSSNERYEIFLINPEGRRFRNLKFYVDDDSLIRHLDCENMPEEFHRIYMDDEWADDFIQRAFKAARVHNVVEC